MRLSFVERDGIAGRMGRGWLLAGGLVLAVCMGYSTVARGAEGVVQPIAKTELSPLEQAREKLHRLNQVEDYIWPSLENEGGVWVDNLPLAKGAEKKTIRRILNNPRFREGFSELSKLPKAEAAALIRAEIDEALPVYQKFYRRDLEAVEKSGRENPDQLVGVAYQIGNNKDGSPTPQGVRLQLLALAMMAGDLGLEDARPAVERLVEIALEQRREVYQHPGLSDFLKSDVLESYSLYCRPVLATAMAGTAQGTALKPEDPDAANWILNRFTRGVRNPIQIDLSKREGLPVEKADTMWEQDVIVYKMIDDTEFDALWGAYKK